jgi:hypothetical protein
MPKLKKGSIMGKYYATDEEIDAAMWCIKNNIKISPLKKSFAEDRWYIEITLNGKTHRSPESYGKTVVWEKMYEFYLYYYNLYIKNINNEE